MMAAPAATVEYTYQQLTVSDVAVLKALLAVFGEAFGEQGEEGPKSDRVNVNGEGATRVKNRACFSYA
jgi:hypothetical protein